jgi:molybdenum cofactor cytidylyltransferase
MRSIGAVILAAGAGTRYGCPKALAETEGRTWLQLAYELLTGAGIDSIAIVLGAEAKRVRADSGIENRPLWLVNSIWDQGRTGSIKLGLAGLPPGLDAVFLHQVDFPAINESTIRQMAYRFEELKSQQPARDVKEYIILPVHGGKSGHPILIGKALFSEIDSLGNDEPLSKVINHDSDRIAVAEVDDPGIFRNINTRTD